PAWSPFTGFGPAGCWSNRHSGSATTVFCEDRSMQDKMTIVRAFVAATVVFGAAACGGAASEGPVLLFDSRSPIQGLRERLSSSGGDLSRVISVKSSSDLAALKTGARYKFVVRADGQLMVAPLPADAPD